MRFRPEQHLSRPRDIRRVREEGRRFDCRAFTVWWSSRPESAEATVGQLPRVCVIASRQAVGSAVQRNRAKRRLREVFRHQQAHVPGSCDLLLIARSGTNTWPLSELESRFSDACSQLRRPATETQ